MAEYVTLPSDPHQHVFELFRFAYNAGAKVLVNRSYPLERKLEAMKRAAVPLNTKQG